MTGTRYWSTSKKLFLALEDMHDSHLLNALKKFERGEYLVPPDPDDPLVLAPPEDGERMELASVFASECRRRAIGKYAPVEPMEEGFA